MANIITCLLLLLGVGCGLNGQAAEKASLLVHCGSSMRPAAEVLAADYEKRYGVKIEFNFGGTETLLPQIELRKEGDLFICHDPFGEKLKRDGLQTKAVTVGYLTPVIIVPKGNPKYIHALLDLLQPGLRVGVTDPRFATCGQMVEERLRKLHLAKSFNDHPNFVLQTRSHGDVANALTIGSIDAGVVWNFIAVTFRDKMDMIPTGQHFPDTRIMVCQLRCAKNPAGAARFLRFAASHSGRKVFADHGYSRTIR